MVTFAEARNLVLETLEPDWIAGELVTAPDGLEDAASFLVTYGRKEWVVDEDPKFLPLDLPVALVDRASGRVSLVPYLTHAKKVDAMRPTR